MIENEVKNWLTNEMSLDVNDIEHKLLQLSSNDKNLICEFILKCVSICKSYNTESTSMNRDFHSHPQVKVFTELFSAIEENMEVSESKVVLDSIRQAFSHFAVGGLLQLYKRQENEVWYPKVALRSILTPNDIHLLPDVVEVYRGCDITEYHLKKFNQAWTTKEEIAHDFAFSHYSSQNWFKVFNRVVLKSTIDRSKVFYAKDSGEFEVVIDTKFLNNVEMIKSSPLISVVMSVYNGEKYLVEAIQSILNQTYKNFEFIIINDGSKDNSVEIIKNYMKQDNRIVLIDRENKGLPYSLNEGISIAKGEYIARMDADDISLPTRFEKQVDYMEKNELDVCGSYIKLFGDNRKEQVIKNPITNEDIRFSLLFFSCLAHPTVVFKKEVFDKVKYNVDYKVAQDYQLWCDIANANFKIGNIPEVLLNYREHEAQASIEKFKRQQDTAHKIASDYAKKLEKEEINLVNQIITSKKTIGLKEIKKLFDDIKDYANKKSIQNDLIFYILKKIYIDSNPKSPMKYFLYRKATKNSNKKFKEEMNMFLKSFVIFSRDSKIYQFLKKLKNKGIQ